MSEANPIICKVAELQLADVVELFEGPFGTGVVKQIRDGMVTIFRPYGASDDFSYTGGVICYVGMEDCKYHIDSPTKFKVFSRKELK